MITREQAHDEAMRASIDSIAGYLQEALGQRLTAYAVGIKDPRTIGRWARGEQGQKPREATAQRLRGLFEITQLLLGRESPETVRAWLLGANPLLDDRAPVELLHQDDHPPVHRTAATDVDAGQGYRTVVSAAEEFVREA